ncbi:pathway-specific regulatory nit-4 [Fusarium agapanthi]|uniref:Pathway-specific regulatory nit-4 n=1 Tax=Fusarium agapanthi TaxID=1803897 RepID=A0A9P5BKA7_9HYPO|nr:pathway-specific regulatory nit-4 [Fusarium agapanthi]
MAVSQDAAHATTANKTANIPRLKATENRRHTNAYTNALEARVASLEKQLAQRNGDPGTPDSAKNSSNCDHEEVTFVSTTQASQPAPNDTASEEDMDDLVNALGCFTLGEIGELRCFGASSNFSIIRNHAIKVPSSIQARNRGIEAANNMPDFITPSDEMRDHLLEIFWRWQNSWQYIVPRELFVRDLYVEKNGRYCTPSLMAAILAMSSRSSQDYASLRMRSFNDIYGSSNSTSGLYWATIDNEGLGFMYIGMATRMAMNLGLHCDCSPYASKGLVSDDDVDARNVTFWGVYVLEKFYCLCMGRPASIQEYNITTTKPKGLVQHSPLLSDHQYEISAPFPTSRILENSMYTCELLLATSEVIDQLYAQRYAQTDKEREDRVMKAHLQAVGLFDRLPKSLKISSSSLQCSPPYVYQFHLQYHHAILLLHRPFFPLLNPGKSAIAYDPEGGDIHSNSCRESAVKMARILQIFRKNYTIRNIPVSAAHPAFTAAIIHLLHIKSSGNNGRSEAMRCLYICVKSLYEMNVIYWNWANRSIRAMLSLARELYIDIWAHGLAQEINEETRRQFEPMKWTIWWFSMIRALRDIDYPASDMSEV